MSYAEVRGMREIPAGEEGGAMVVVLTRWWARVLWWRKRRLVAELSQGMPCGVGLEVI